MAIKWIIEHELEVFDDSLTAIKWRFDLMLERAVMWKFSNNINSGYFKFPGIANLDVGSAEYFSWRGVLFEQIGEDIYVAFKDIVEDEAFRYANWMRCR